MPNAKAESHGPTLRPPKMKPSTLLAWRRAYTPMPTTMAANRTIIPTLASMRVPRFPFPNKPCLMRGEAQTKTPEGVWWRRTRLRALLISRPKPVCYR